MSPTIMYWSEPTLNGNKKEVVKMKFAEMKVLGWMYCVSRLDRIKNKYIRGNLGLTNITRKIRENKLK